MRFSDLRNSGLVDLIDVTKVPFTRKKNILLGSGELGKDVKEARKKAMNAAKKIRVVND